MKMNQLARLLRDNPINRAKPLNVRNAADVADVYLYDIIDSYFGIGAQEFADALNALTAPTINVHINSPGGDVFDGRAMATAIRNHSSRIVARVDGLAASAASTVAVAADEIVMAAGSFMMIHRAWTFAFGNAEDLMSTAAVLEKIDGEIIADYVRKTGKSADDIRAMVDAETWMTADEAYLNGFADRVDDGDDAKAAENRGAATVRAAAWNLGAYEHVPRQLLDGPGGDDDAMLRARNVRRLRLIETVSH